MLDQYLALGDGHSLDLYPQLASPEAKGPASILAVDLLRENQCGRFRNLAEMGAGIGEVYRNQLRQLTQSKTDTIVTLHCGLEDVVNAACENPTWGPCRRALDEVASNYRSLVKAIRKTLPKALIVLSTAPDASLGTGVVAGTRRFPSKSILYFNEKLKADHEGLSDVVIADAWLALNKAEHWWIRCPTELSPLGAAVLGALWLTALSQSEYMEAA